MSRREAEDSPVPPARRALVVAAAGVVPWLVIPYGDGYSLVLSVALANPETLTLTSVYHYVFVYTRDIPTALLAWPVASLLYVSGVASAALSRVGREDRRVTAGLFALAGLDVLYAAVGFSSYRAGVVAIPLGVVGLWLAAWTSRP
ncbi:TIGR04206 family protein [Halosimplex salinum]|uniref:TIGR04206 family protein n=1 Tax=Halosimplex salinum TaxID=1710538 RepID=UPI000F466871|nr:TIGR04206 family protein [Halosimplex salinum]